MEAGKSSSRIFMSVMYRAGSCPLCSTGARGKFITCHRILDRGRIGQLYHLSPDQGIAVRDVVRMVCAQMKVDFEDVVRPVGERLGQDSAYIIDSSKAREKFSWRPEIALEDGIGGVIRWIEDYWPRVRVLPFDYIHKF